MSIHETAMLASVKISTWSGRKHDREVTDEVNRDHGASADAGRYNKVLVSKEALAKITTISNKARTTLYARTAPWMDNGTRILTAAGYLAFAAEMKALRQEFEIVVDEFIADYDKHVARAQVALNGMFKASDYPTEREIRRKFGFDSVIMPLPVAADFRVDISASERAAIVADIEERTQQAIAGAMADVFTRICENVGAMAEKLAAFKPAKGKGEKSEGVFRNTLVSNVADLIALLPSLNITNDPKLAAITGQMQALVKYDADTLRENADLRQDVAAKAQAILDDVSAYIA